MSLQRLELALAGLLTGPDLAVTVGAPDPGAAPSAGLAVTEVAPRQTLASRRPIELDPLDIRRIAPITARVVITVQPGVGDGDRATGLGLATDLWWRCDDVAITSGSGFPSDVAEGYLVEAVAPRELRTADHEDADGTHRIELDVDGAVWPIGRPGEVGRLIAHTLIRLGRQPMAEPTTRVAVGRGETVAVPALVDLRSMAVDDPDSEPAERPGPPERAFRIRVEPTGDDAVGTVPADPVQLDDSGAFTIAYTAGDVSGTDRVVLELVGDDGGAVPAGSFEIEVEG